MKYGSVEIDDQSFDMQRDLTIDLAGSFKSISEARSRGNEEYGFDIDEDSPLLLL